MNLLKYLVRRTRTNPRIPAAIACLALVVTGFLALHANAWREVDARKNPQARQLEQAPDRWLSRQTSASELRRALDAGTLTVVGVAASHPGLVLYTLKNGDRASVTVPGCPAMGCTGTVACHMPGMRWSATGCAPAWSNA